MTVATPLGGKSDCCGGGGDCPDPGDCPDGQECLPSTYVAPCADGTECLPSDYIDPDDCPASGPGLIESPDDITGLIGWYDASDGASFTLDGDDRVDGWTDKSGNGNDLENEGGGGAAGPLHDGATTLNGLPVVVFDTPDRRLSAPSGIDQAQPFTVFVVGASTDAFAGDFGSSYTWWSLGGPGASLQRRPDATHDFYVDAGGSPSYPANRFAAVDGKPYYITVVVDDAGADSLARANGVEQFSGLDLGGNDASTKLYVGSDSGGHAMGHGNGYIAELIVYSGHLSADDIAAVEDYLLRKWFSDVVDGPDCGYRPYCLNADEATDLDTAVLALTPFAYYKLDDASGNPQDSSGNGNHATTIAGTVTYQDAALSVKANDSIRLNGAVVVIPPPTANPGVPASGDWSAIMLASFHDFDTSVTANGMPAILSWTPAGGSPAQFIWSNLAGRQFVFTDGSFGCNPGQSESPWVMDLDTPYVIALVASTNWITVYVNGTVWVTAVRYGNQVNGDTFTLGRAADTFWSAADWNVSNLAIFDSALAYADVQAITEAMLDASMIAVAPVFT